MDIEIVNSGFIVKLIDSDTCHIKFKDNSISYSQDMIECYESCMNLSNGQQLKKLIEFGENVMFEYDLSVFENKDVLTPIAAAFVTDDLALRLVIRHQSLYVDPFPKKIFKSSVDALEWLSTM